MPEIDNQDQFIKWFRHSSPYINAHRGKTFVILFDGDTVNDDNFSNIIHDIALLNSLGIKLVLVHGARPQINTRLKEKKIDTKIINHIRVTDEQALNCVKEAVGSVKMTIEAMLSMGVANSPMAGAKIRVVSGNYVMAKPYGIHDGIDYCFTGE
ncbi:MAG: amino-acid N-acetyltransferase, partial [Gammaproteobacteria bacterium]|nr:amino-acid N-acetyltransferase [Gammaproteobacteria bacterium]